MTVENSPQSKDQKERVSDDDELNSEKQRFSSDDAIADTGQVDQDEFTPLDDSHGLGNDEFGAPADDSGVETIDSIGGGQTPVADGGSLTPTQPEGTLGDLGGLSSNIGGGADPNGLNDVLNGLGGNPGNFNLGNMVPGGGLPGGFDPASIIGGGGADIDGLLGGGDIANGGLIPGLGGAGVPDLGGLGDGGVPDLGGGGVPDLGGLGGGGVPDLGGLGGGGVPDLGGLGGGGVPDLGGLGGGGVPDLGGFGFPGIFQRFNGAALTGGAAKPTLYILARQGCETDDSSSPIGKSLTYGTNHVDLWVPSDVSATSIYPLVVVSKGLGSAALNQKYADDSQSILAEVSGLVNFKNEAAQTLVEDLATRISKSYRVCGVTFWHY